MATLSDYLACYGRCLDAFEASRETGYELLEDYPQAGFYVYALIDPIDSRIFYVGKGIGGRVLKHEERTRRGVLQNRAKVKRIQSIYAQGKEVVRRVLFVSDSEEVVLSVEADTIRRLASLGLTNIVAGEHVQHPAVRQMAGSFGETLAAMRQAFLGGVHGA